MSNRSIKIERIPTTTEKVVEISVSYTLGGPNYFTGGHSPRGYYAHVQPLKVEKNFITMEAFTGIKDIIEPANRFSQKKLEAVAEAIKGSDQIKMLVAHVLNKQGITLAQKTENVPDDCPIGETPAITA